MMILPVYRLPVADLQDEHSEFSVLYIENYAVVAHSQPIVWCACKFLDVAMWVLLKFAYLIEDSSCDSAIELL